MKSARFFLGFTIFTLLLLISSLGCSKPGPATKSEVKEEKRVIRVGYFPNITHSQALVGMAQGTFQEALGPNVKIETKVFNAGPSAIEALFAGAIDLTYIGPNPAINGYVKSKGEALRIVAGATSGGAVFVVRSDAKVNKPQDLSGKSLASPQLGNTQDVALRFYLKENGLASTEKGGTVKVVPTENPDILTLFLKKEIEGAWVPEPWGARLVKEGGGRLFLDERELWPDGQFVTAHVIVSKKFLEENPGLVKKWLRGHVQTTKWINEHKEEAQTVVNEEIKKIAGKSLAADVLKEAFSRLKVTYDPIKSSLFKSAENAFELGFIQDKDIDGIYDLSLLNEALKDEGLGPIK
jgi:NitT/TauT family transport system substrate-binding protein